MKSLTLHPHGCPRAAKGYSSTYLQEITSYSTMSIQDLGLFYHILDYIN